MTGALFGQPLSPGEFRRRLEALFDKVIRIGDMTFGEQAEPLLGMMPAMLPAVPTSPETGTPAPAPLATFSKHLPERLDLAAAQARLPFALCLPAWVPEGFARVGEVSVSGPDIGRVEAEADPADAELHRLMSSSAHLVWRHADGRGFNYSVVHWPPEDETRLVRGIIPVPPGAVRAVRVNGRPAALLTRSFFTEYPAQVSDVSADPQLMWQAGQLHYTLRSFKWPAAGEALVQIAASIPTDD